ncbi:penicillin-insensitive murein endopeptidase [Jiella sp. MQZ9-1]|uniref:Penicillin-insensitive murein endopeptidase n=1 Tax=Jiella flava TaxID=2816857 RepID=A0A939JVT1_9HYPH|nr:penicillin-insensitive murein endopeptidase [Jiella flava]MBO0661581.1 penicillin-insensitive murein endopeptidase [Jiella flava]MCD2470223.1 penicillin-insensitive murein endopeptidase [Jiella flava]
MIRLPTPVAVTLVIASALGPFAIPTAQAEPAAKFLFSQKKTPTAGPTRSIGFYSNGCLGGGAQLPADGPHWQAMRLSRNRRFGNPVTIAVIERIAGDAAKTGVWPGLLVGDISQPRGGPMSSGHSSHQIGLDFDVWLRPMPTPRLTAAQRETYPFRSVLKKGTFSVDDRIWNDHYRDLIKITAEQPEVQRIFVHPGIKKKLCETAGRDRGWLAKVRPYYGHYEHFHVRLFCPPGSTTCKPQKAAGSGDGCSKLDWWFNVALQPSPPNAKPPKPKPPLTLAGMPAACRAVLAAPAAGGASGGAMTAAQTTPPPAGALVAKPSPRPRR